MRGRWVAAVVAAVVPWSWFLLRDALGVVGDVVAILLPALVAALVVAGVVAARRRREWLVPVGSVLVMGTVAVVGPWLPTDAGPVRSGGTVTVAAANLMHVLTPTASLLAVAPDVLVVAEAPEDQRVSTLEPLLASTYRYRETSWNGPGVAVFSRLPMRLLDGPGPELPGMRLLVQGPAGPFVLYALHVPRPWLTDEGGFQATVAEHHAIMTALAARIAAETGPAVVAGDLNSPDRGRDYRTLVGTTRLVDAARSGAVTFSSTGQWTPLLLRIDHLMVTAGWCGDAARQIDLPGSDHRGVTATVGPCVGSGA